jgi:maltose alpha-D-glucosyltransferase/alpha-amylase
VQHEPQRREWFEGAVFYEALVRSFQDSNGDGIGDLQGLISRLDHLQWLGVTCLWLPPFYPSPLRDGGYDVSDFCAVDPKVGDLADFLELVDAAHARGLRLIVDFVANHTSDQHPWFQASVADPDGPFGDFYVWADDDTGYPGVRVIFSDTETSNWAWEPTRGQYYWHRFFSHQPDLNYDNPAVREAVLAAMRFWLDLGVDGFRLDAVPYLYAREGTDCAHLPETHSFLKQARKLLDYDYPGTVLLAEANGWPDDVADYFGDGDECQLAFHFPLMPRLFMAVRQESKDPITDILARTPAAPAGCSWMVFLRNHDELTLEMVTEDERDFMVAEYAADPQMLKNVGIRRRLAPLLEGSRRQLELLTTLLLTLPGTPILYYGDEIGMGDNVYLGDRDGVRTPMQWTPDRNAGFSTCDPQKLLLPVNADPVYGYASVNVEAQRRQPHSLLTWTRELLQLRGRQVAFLGGSYAEVPTDNPSVLAFVRERDGDAVLCLHNLSRHPQPARLVPGRYEGSAVVELHGQVRFPALTAGYALSLGGYDSILLSLSLWPGPA